MDSLTLDDNSPTLEETLAKMRPNDTEVALDQPPLSINVIPPQEEMALLLATALKAYEPRFGARYARLPCYEQNGCT